jgi:hypothetical protein
LDEGIDNTLVYAALDLSLAADDFIGCTPNKRFRRLQKVAAHSGNFQVSTSATPSGTQVSQVLRNVRAAPRKTLDDGSTVYP